MELFVRRCCCPSLDRGCKTAQLLGNLEIVDEHPLFPFAKVQKAHCEAAHPVLIVALYDAHDMGLDADGVGGSRQTQIEDSH